MKAPSSAPEPLVLRARRPAPPLDAWIDCLWHASGTAAYQRYKVLPNGVVELIVNLGSDAHGVVDSRRPERVDRYQRSWLAGLQLGAIIVESLARTDLIGVRFRPGGAAPFLALSLAEITDHVVELDTVLTREAPRLRDRLLGAASPEARFDVLEAWLQRRLAGARVEPAVTFVCARLAASRGCTPIRDLVTQTGWSHKRLINRFRDAVGATPKSLARVHRLQHALGLLPATGSVDWTYVAIASGYSDQAHFNHEFREFTGLTPSQYLATRVRDDPNHAGVS